MSEEAGFGPSRTRREGGPRARLWPRRLGSSRSRTPTSSLIKWGNSWSRREASGHKAQTLGADAGRVDGVWFVPVELVCLGLNRHPTDADARGEGADGPQLSVGRAGGSCRLPGHCSAPSPWGPLTQLLRERGRDIEVPPTHPTREPAGEM